MAVSKTFSRRSMTSESSMKWLFYELSLNKFPLVINLVTQGFLNERWSPKPPVIHFILQAYMLINKKKNCFKDLLASKYKHRNPICPHCIRWLNGKRWKVNSEKNYKRAFWHRVCVCVAESTRLSMRPKVSGMSIGWLMTWLLRPWSLKVGLSGPARTMMEMCSQTLWLRVSKTAVKLQLIIIFCTPPMPKHCLKTVTWMNCLALNIK